MIVDAAAAPGEVIWTPDDSVVAGSGVARFVQFLRDHGVDLADDYDQLWQWSVDELDRFWELFAEFAEVDIRGRGPVRTDEPMPDTRWFPARTVNFARHLLEGRDGTALVAVDEEDVVVEVSWQSLRDEVGAFAEYLRNLGVVAGDRVVGILPNIKEAVVAFLGAASLGAVWSVCAPEFGAGAIVARFHQLAPRVLIAVPGYRLSGSDRDRREDLIDILAGLPSVEHVVWVTEHTTVPPVHTDQPSVTWDEAVSRRAPLTYAELEFSEPLWVLFSSGTTGVPKGIVHGHGGALLEVLKMLLIHSDLRPGDRYLNVASTSWVLWNSLVSALGVGATPVLIDGNPTYPSIDRVWKVAADTRAAALGVSAGFIHACAKTEVAPAKDHDLSALRCLQVTGSPLSNDGYRWVYTAVGDVWLASMSGGTDIASVFVGGVPTLPVRVGFIQTAALGVRVESWDESGDPTTAKGELVVTAPMPSMPLRLWGDDDASRYRSSYFDTYPGVWRHGDFIEFTAAGILIHGRSDSTLNRNGLRLGSADIYAIVEALPEVREALVIGAEIGAEGYYMPLFVALSDGADADETSAAIVRSIRVGLSSRYLPDEIIVMRGIPHTRTGKKLEVPVKRMVQGAALEDVVDLGSVDDADLMREYAAFAAERALALFGARG